MPASESPLYEVRCESCRVSFPPEARRCIHCGGPLGVGRAMTGTGDVADDELPFQRGRSVVWVVTAVVALALSMLRNCQSS
jgi:hypothetical protein